MIIARLFSIRKRLFWGWLGNKILKIRLTHMLHLKRPEFIKCYSNKITIESSSLVLVTEWMKGADLSSLRWPRFNSQLEIELFFIVSCSSGMFGDFKIEEPTIPGLQYNLDINRIDDSMKKKYSNAVNSRFKKDFGSGQKVS